MEKEPKGSFFCVLDAVFFGCYNEAMNRETGEVVEKIERKMNRYCRRDWLIAVALTVVMLILGACSLTYGMPSWGHDDFAAYISEGIAISEGRLEEQTRLNYTLHPSELPDEASPDGLMYVWGYPLMLSAVFAVTHMRTWKQRLF